MKQIVKAAIPKIKYSDLARTADLSEIIKAAYSS